MLTWQIPAITPPWTKDFESIYIELLGSQTRLVKGAKYTTRVIEAGEGEPLILLHGVGGTAESWFRNIMTLAKDFHVCAIDQLFHGFTSKEAIGATDRTGAMVDHIIDFMDAMGFERAHVEGESMGGSNAFHLALKYPDRVGKVVLNTASPLVINLKRPEFREPYKSIESLRLLSMNALEQPNPRTVRTRLEWLMTTPDRVTDELVSLRLKFATMPAIQAAQTGGGLPGQPPSGEQTIEEKSAQIKAPTLVLWSEFNPDSGIERGEYLSSLIPGSKFASIDDAAHWPQYEHPKEHDEVVTRFLKTGNV
jgi:pimeloyl-ACP methyl ester carboxylesterase